MKYRTFVIGDIHGCYDELYALTTNLIVKAGMQPKKDRLVFLGDYVDRGLKTRQVIETLMKWNKKYPHWQFLYGNHEDLMLDALVYKGQIYQSYDLWWEQGGKETAYSYIPEDRSAYEKAISSVKDTIPAEHLDWLRNRPYYFEDENYFYVHGGVLPETSLEEVKFYLTDTGFNKVKQAVIWARDEFINSNYDWGKKIIFGHTADGTLKYNQKRFMPIVKENKIGIDTAPNSPQGRLTALELPAEKFWFQEHLTKNSPVTFRK